MTRQHEFLRFCCWAEQYIPNPGHSRDWLAKVRYWFDVMDELEKLRHG